MPVFQAPIRTLAAFAGALWLSCGTAVAQETGTSATAPSGTPQQPPSIDELLRRLDTLEDRNRELEQRVTSLTQEQGEAWIGEQRAAQVREIVGDVLADSQSRATLQDSGMTAGWNGNFFLASADGRFLLNIGGFTQSRFTFNRVRPGAYSFAPPAGNQFVFDRRGDRWGFGLPDVQLWADGHVFSKDFQYMVKARFYQQVATQFGKGNAGAVAGDVDFSGFELLDAWMRFNLDDNWSVRAGQYRSPYSRGFLVQEQYQMSAARSVVDFHYALGYTQGVELKYQNDEFRMTGSADNGAEDNLIGDTDSYTGGNLYKIYPTGSLSPTNNPWWTQNSLWSVTSRLEWKPSGSWNQFKSFTSPAGETFGLLVGMGAHWQQSKPYQTNMNTPGVRGREGSQWLALTADAQANFGGASLYGAFFYNYVDAPSAMEPVFGAASPTTTFDFGSVNILAFQIQGAIYLAPKWELFGRYEFAWMTGQNEAFIQSTPAGGNPLLADADPMNLITLGVNYYIDGQDVKWTTDLGWAITAMNPWFADVQAGYRPSRSDEIVFRTQMQLMF
jgi:hypothetical protein